MINGGPWLLFGCELRSISDEEFPPKGCFLNSFEFGTFF